MIHPLHEVSSVGGPALPAAEGVQDAPGPDPEGILIVDDHDLVRLGIRALVQAHAGPASAPPAMFEARNLQEALEVFAAHAALIGTVLLDLALPDSRGLSGLIEFRKRFPLARIAVLSGTANSAQAQGALNLGASAFLAKSADLAEVMRYVLRRRPSDADTPRRASPDPALAPEAPSGFTSQLSQRQLQIMDWILAGKSNREIADLAHLSEGTVKNHVSTILLVFGMRSRAQLISGLR